MYRNIQSILCFSFLITTICSHSSQPFPKLEKFLSVKGEDPCPQNQTLINNTCQCKKNFVSDNQDCICNTEEFVYNGTDCVCSWNATQVGDKCVCRTNFVQDGAQCLCDENQFQFKGSLCICNYYATQVNKTCICLQNFIKNGNKCECPQSFQLKSLDRKCLCSGYVQNFQCIECSFPCASCSGPGFNCLSYQVLFFIIIISGAILVILLFGGTIWCLKKKRQINRAEQDQSLLNSREGEN